MRTVFVAILSMGLLAFPGSGAQKPTSRARGNAFLKSLVLPGWGQYDSGRKRSAVFFALGELAVFSGMYAFHVRGVVKRRDYIAYAAQYAGVVGDHPQSFYVDVGNWDRVEDYNEQRLKDREFDQLYTSPLDRWEWDSYAHRVRMKKIRVQSGRAFNTVYYLIGGLILNHIGSAIHAGRGVRGSKNGDSASRAWRFFVAPVSDRQGLSLHFNYSF
jgi:hypothetical protein